jgi:hypothetical protein
MILNPYGLPYDPFEHIVPGLMPAREVHLICGPPGIGKTTLCLDLLPQIERGDLILGHARANPTKSVFISCDRSESAHIRRQGSLGMPFWDAANPDPRSFPFFSGISVKLDIPEEDDDDHELKIQNIIRICAQNFPDRPLLFIDGFAALIEDSSNYRQAQQLLRKTTRSCIRHNRTVLASVHSPKAKEGQTYNNPREQILGSQAWAGFSDLVIAMQPADLKDPTNPRRLVHVCSRSLAGDYTIKMILQNGRLVLDDSIERDLYSLLLQWLLKIPYDRQIPTREILTYGVKDCALSLRSVERWIEEQVENGVLERVAKGLYRRKLQA